MNEKATEKVTVGRNPKRPGPTYKELETQLSDFANRLKQSSDELDRTKQAVSMLVERDGHLLQTVVLQQLAWSEFGMAMHPELVLKCREAVQRALGQSRSEGRDMNERVPDNAERIV